MYDLRNYKALVKEAVKSVNENANWKWTAIVNKNEIKLTNGYIKGEYSGDFNDYFSIKTCELFDGDTETELETRDCLHLYVDSEALSDDGTIEQCISKEVRAANRYFESRY